MTRIFRYISLVSNGRYIVPDFIDDITHNEARAPLTPDSAPLPSSFPPTSATVAPFPPSDIVFDFVAKFTRTMIDSDSGLRFAGDELSLYQ